MGYGAASHFLQLSDGLLYEYFLSGGVPREQAFGEARHTITTTAGITSGNWTGACRDGDYRLIAKGHEVDCHVIATDQQISSTLAITTLAGVPNDAVIRAVEIYGDGTGNRFPFILAHSHVGRQGVR